MYLLDTDTLIYFLKGNPAVVANFKAHMDIPKALSVITYGELVYGCHKSQRTTANLARIHRLAEIYPVIDVSRSVMDSFGDIKAQLSASGNTVDDFDILIGCTALALNYTVVTNNTRHYGKIHGLRVVNWNCGGVKCECRD
jgi:tRNA(fMet)-specific endonuclease VapC